MVKVKRDAPWDPLDSEAAPEVEEPAAEKPFPQKAERVRRINFDVPESLHKRMRMKAVEEEATIADVGRELFDKWVGE